MDDISYHSPTKGGFSRVDQPEVQLFYAIKKNNQDSLVFDLDILVEELHCDMPHSFKGF